MNDRETELTVSGMSCGSCVRHVQKALAQLDGVRSVDVRLQDGAVRVVHDVELAPAGRLAAVIEDAGYGVLVRRS